jgi:steroid 5-alpha reductase family enzyme
MPAGRGHDRREESDPVVKSARPDRRISICALLLAYLVAGAAAVSAAPAARRLVPGLSPVLAAAAADLLATIVVFAFSAGFDNSSIYDPYWSVAPVPIALFWTLASGGAGTRARQAAVLVLLGAWAVRLTVNCLARWQGLGDEDWRYAGYRRLGPWYWPVSFLGFHLMPTVFVFLGCLPLWPALTAKGTGLGFLDLAAALVTAGAIGIEALADAELRRFLSRPKSSRRLIDEGLWKLLRHPNYVGEVAFWWGLWLFGLAADPSWWWTIAGPVAITLMFLFISVPMMERHLRGRRTYASPRRRTASSTMAR